MSKKVTKNQDFKALFETVSDFLIKNDYMSEIGNASKITFKDECDDTCLDCQTFSESRPDPRRPGKYVVVIVRKCVRRV